MTIKVKNKEKKKKSNLNSRLNNKNKMVKGGGSSFVEETKAEVRKITWPNKETVTKASLIVLFIVVFSTTFVAVLDVMFAKIILKLTA